MLSISELKQREHGRSEISVSQVVTTGSAYGSGNCLGGLITLDPSVSNGGPIKESPLSAALSGVVLLDPDSNGPATDLFFFNALPASAFTDKTAFAPSVADLKLLCGYVAIATGDWVAAGANGKIAGGVNQQNLHRILKPVSGTALYCVAVVRATPTFTNGTVNFKFQFDA